MQDEWTTTNSRGTVVKFSYSELPDGKAFLTAQIAGHDVVYSVIADQEHEPFSRERVERRFDRELRPPSADRRYR